MPLHYDIYGLSNERNSKTLEVFLSHFSDRRKIEDKEGQEITVYSNEKYDVTETVIPVNTLTEVIDFGLENPHLGFAFYIDEHLKEDIAYLVLKFTFDGKIIFGVSIEEKTIDDKGILTDNYDKALAIEQSIAELTKATKTSIQFEYVPSDDEEEFDHDIEIWKTMNEEKLKK